MKKHLTYIKISAIFEQTIEQDGKNKYAFIEKSENNNKDYR